MGEKGFGRFFLKGFWVSSRGERNFRIAVGSESETYVYNRSGKSAPHVEGRKRREQRVELRLRRNELSAVF